MPGLASCFSIEQSRNISRLFNAISKPTCCSEGRAIWLFHRNEPPFAILQCANPEIVEGDPMDVLRVKVFVDPHFRHSRPFHEGLVVPLQNPATIRFSSHGTSRQELNRDLTTAELIPPSASWLGEPRTQQSPAQPGTQSNSKRRKESKE